MKNTIRSVFSAAILLIFFHQVYADPWFIGPLLAPSGQSLDVGHANFETFAYFTTSPGLRLNRSSKLVATASSANTLIDPVFTYGLAKKLDVELDLPYVFNYNQGKKGQYIGDISVQLGWQIYAQSKNPRRPDIRITIQEIFPTGPYQRLNPAFQETDGTGSGSYQTVIGLNFQYLQPVGKSFYLNSHLSFSYLYASPVAINGHNVYGGNDLTNGKINLGSQGIIDWAEEFSLTQNWALALEAYYFHQGESKFKGEAGVSELKIPLVLGAKPFNSISLAPAIEYSFSENYGVIAGAWFSVSGNASANFRSSVIAFNASW